MPDILAIMIMDEDTGKPLYTHLVDEDIKRDPSVIPQKIQTKEIIMINELGVQLNLVFSILAEQDDLNLRKSLREFRDRVEQTYPEGLKEGTGTFADYVILEGMVISIFLDH